MFQPFLKCLSHILHLHITRLRMFFTSTQITFHTYDLTVLQPRRLPFRENEFSTHPILHEAFTDDRAEARRSEDERNNRHVCRSGQACRWCVAVLEQHPECPHVTQFGFLYILGPSLSLSLSLASLARYSFLPSNKMEMSPLLTREAWARRDVRCVSGRAFIVPS